MIAFVRGTLIEKKPTHVVVDVQGVGFQLWIPLSSFDALGEVGESVHVLAYLHAREDALRLYGFATAEERDLFLLLISVSGVGPRLAQGILSGITVEAFEGAVRRQDIAALTAAPGVGKKTAERLVLELREKIGDGWGDRGIPAAGSAPPEAEEAVLALVSLGYKRAKALQAVQGVIRREGSISVEETVRQALRIL